jgi:hypothetical protein
MQVYIDLEMYIDLGNLFNRNNNKTKMYANVLKILEFFNLFLVTVQSAKVNLPKDRTPRDGH